MHRLIAPCDQGSKSVKLCIHPTSFHKFEIRKWVCTYICRPCTYVCTCIHTYTSLWFKVWRWVQVEMLTCLKCQFRVSQTNDQVNRSSYLSGTFNQRSGLHWNTPRTRGRMQAYQHGIDATNLSITFLRALNRSEYTTWSGGTPSFQVPLPIPIHNKVMRIELHTNNSIT